MTETLPSTSANVALVERLHAASRWVQNLDGHGIRVRWVHVNDRGASLVVSGWDRGAVETLADLHGTPEVVDGTLPGLRWAVADGVVIEVMGDVERYLDAPAEPRPAPAFRLPEAVES